MAFDLKMIMTIADAWNPGQAEQSNPKEPSFD
jgi:hypothetical protein